jgi:hypothetical protein
MGTEFWNREELYKEVWDKPLIKIAPKYNISAVALGKICQKLQIPVPGRGYWVKKDFGKPVERIPLPEGKDIPPLRRTEFSEAKPNSIFQSVETFDLNDPELMRIATVEKSVIRFDPLARQHKLVAVTARHLKHAETDDRGVLIVPRNEITLDLRVTKSSVERALRFMNGIILALEAEDLVVTVQPGRGGTSTEIFGQRVPFMLVERVRLKRQREVKEYLWTRKVNVYEPTGEFELRIGGSDYGRSTSISDGTTRKLEDILSECVGRMMRRARKFRLDNEKWEKRRREEEQKRKEREDLARQIRDEVKNLKDLEGWVAAWEQAERMRKFIAALQSAWTQAGHDLSPDSELGQRLAWMSQQADRLDPMIPSPPSILDRKGEVSQWW